MSTPLGAPRARGRLSVTNRAVARIIAQAVVESSPAVAPGASARLSRRHATGSDATIHLAVHYPASLPAVLTGATEAAQHAAASLAGVDLRRVRFTVATLVPGRAVSVPGPDRAPAPAAVTRPQGVAPARRAPRRWTSRRRPASLLFATGAAACWYGWWIQRRGPEHFPHLVALLRQAATRRADDPVVLGVTGLLGTLGVLLIVLAVTGSRTRSWRLSLPGSTPTVVVDRSLVHREVQQAVGRHRASVRTTRRGVRITAQAPAGSGDLAAAARTGLERAGLRLPAPRIVVRRARPSCRPQGGPAALAALTTNRPPREN